MTIKALEFYSGIGAFAQAATKFDIEIDNAFDQSQWANLTYQTNWGHKPSQRNLDSIPADSIPQADLWWLSPPCTPFSRRGKQKGETDPRSRSFLHLISLLSLKKPRFVLVENVQGFVGSAVYLLLLDTLAKVGYQPHQVSLCPTMFGVPMLRPRIFIIASLEDNIDREASPKNCAPKKLGSYLWENNLSLACDPEILTRYAPVLNIVDPALPDSYLICFTSGYHRCRQASGSLISTGCNRARFLSPAEILGLLGFDPGFYIPEQIPVEAAYRLVGNSVDVRAINFLLQQVLALK